MKNNIQKIGLVTGANSGIGKEIAIGLAKSGVHVIMVCRDRQKGQIAHDEIKKITGSNSVDLLIADLSSQADIHSLAKTIDERYPALHVLINNAGIVLTERKISVDGIEMTLAVNHLGPFLLTLLLKDLLAKSAPARVINVSSAIHKWAKLDLNDLQYEKRKFHFMKAYAQSKLLMTMMTFELAKKFEKIDVTVNCIHPGAVKTHLGSDNANDLFLKLIDKWIKFFFISPKKAAIPILDLALSPDFEKVTGKYFVKGQLAQSSAISHDPAFLKCVWEISTKMVDLNI